MAGTGKVGAPSFANTIPQCGHSARPWLRAPQRGQSSGGSETKSRFYCAFTTIGQRL